MSLIPSRTAGPTPAPESVPFEQRALFVMDLLVNRYNFSVNGASGLVGNLNTESGVLPNRIEGSSSTSPMRSRNFAGVLTTFTPEEVMRRNEGRGIGPKLAGIGLAQWTARSRRNGLFLHKFEGKTLAETILFNTEAQLDYLVNELLTNFKRVHTFLLNPAVSVSDATDEVVYRFEKPASVLGGAPLRLLPREDPNVQREFIKRRRSSQGIFLLFNQR